MRKFSLASQEARDYVDLRDYDTFIIDTVHSVIPKAKVKVYSDCYVVNRITIGESIAIGRKLCHSSLGQHCIKLSKLFCGEDIGRFPEEEKDDET